MTNFLIDIGISKAYAGDIALLLMMILASLVLLFTVKKSKIGAFAFAVYVSYFITNVFYFEFIDTYVIKSIVFIAVALVLHYMLFKPTVVVRLGSGNIVRWVKRVAISFAIVGFMATIILGWMPNREVLEMLSPFALKIFTTSFAELMWAIAPVMVLLVVRQRE